MKEKSIHEMWGNEVKDAWVQYVGEILKMRQLDALLT